MTLNQYIVVFSISLVGGILISEVLNRFWKWSAPPIVQELGYTCRYWYLYPFRWVTPDSVYKLYLQTGLITPDHYRTLQNDDFISDDIDPKHIHHPEQNQKPSD